VTKYVPEVLAVGLAPEDLDGFFVQRLRWAVGGLQIGRYDEKRGKGMGEKRGGGRRAERRRGEEEVGGGNRC
jgi:hypothetical protein